MTKVIDASVVMKLLTEERHSDVAAALMAGEPDRIAPDIISFEVASALSKKVRYADLPVDKVRRALGILPELFAEQVPLAQLIDMAMAFSIELKHAFYDCLYLALAEQRNCVLVTADSKFARAIAQSKMGHRLETLVPFDDLMR